MNKLEPCPICGKAPSLQNVGDHKEYLIYFCFNCLETPVKNCEARCTEYTARKIWNKRVKEKKEGK